MTEVAIATLLGSACIGFALGLLYLVSSIGMAKLALRQEQRLFMITIFGGMLGRMMAALAAIAAIILLLPIRSVPFLTAFLVLLFAGVGLEIRWLANRSNEKRG